MQQPEPASPTPPAEDSEEVIAALLTASRLLVAIAARSLTSIEDTLTLPQYRMLVMLETHGPSNLVRLAERMTVNPSTAMRMVDRLAAAGMIERTTKPQRRREVQLTLTETGANAVRQVTDARHDQIARIVAAMPTERRDQLITALRAFTDAGGEPPAHLPTLPGWQ